MAEPQRLVVVGASMGGVPALQRLVAGLPRELPAAVCVALHLAPGATSRLPEILTRAGPLPALHPKRRERLACGRIYVAPPDRHLRVEGGDVLLSRGAKENGHRPSVDVLFRSAARAFGERAIGVVLTGALDCGAAGMHAIQQAGGLTVVQDPDEAQCPDMPLAAMRSAAIDHVVPLEAIGPLLTRLVAEPPRPAVWPAPQAVDEQDYSCPACGGILQARGDEAAPQFACQVGHVYSPLGLHSAQGEQLEAALWTALRVLEENESLTRSLGRRAGAQGRNLSQQRFRERALSVQRKAALIRRALRITPDDEPGKAEDELVQEGS